MQGSNVSNDMGFQKCFEDETPQRKEDTGIMGSMSAAKDNTKKSTRSAPQKKSYNKPDNSLLNFHFERPTPTSSFQSQSSMRNYTPSERRIKARNSLLSKETFLQANFRFIVNPTANTLDPAFYDPDCPVPWETVDCVIVPHNDANQYNNGISSVSGVQACVGTPGGPCPICLGELKIPRMTKCGHLFCYTCILRYLGATNEVYQKCPLCSDRFNKSGLKSVKFNTANVPKISSADMCGHGEKERRQDNKEKDKEKERDKTKGNTLEKKERRGSEEDQGERYTLQLLFIEKDSLYPTLPGRKSKGKNKSDNNLSASNTNQKNKIKNTPNQNFNSIPGSGSTPGPIYPTIVTLCESHLVPLSTSSRGRFSRIVTVSLAGYLDLIEEERLSLMAYRDECLDSGSGYIDADLRQSTTSTGIGGGDRWSSCAVTSGINININGSSSSSSGDATGNRSRSDSCWGSNTPAPTPAPAPHIDHSIMHAHTSHQLLSDQGDTEYLPAISEALLLLSDKEQVFKDRCHKLGLVIVPSPSSPSTSTLVSKKCSDSTSSDSAAERCSRGGSDNLDDDIIETPDYAILVSSSLSASSTPFIPSSFSALATSAPLSVASIPSTSSPSIAAPLPPSPTIPNFKSPASTSTQPPTPTTPSSDLACATVCTTSCSTSIPLPTPPPSAYHMFQSPQGELIYLHPLCTKCLLASVQNDPYSLPHAIAGIVLETEKIRVNAASKQKVPFLRYLPEYCEVVLVEVNMRNLVPNEVWDLFQEEFNKRAKKRKDKQKILKKEKKQENDEMLAHSLYVEEVNALHLQSSREQSLRLEQLLSGPRVGEGEADKDKDKDSEGKEEKEGEDGEDIMSGGDEKERVKDDASQSAAVLSFAHIAQIGKGESFPSLGSSKPRAASSTPHPLSIRHKAPSQPVEGTGTGTGGMWGRGLSPTPTAQASPGGRSVFTPISSQAPASQGGWGKKGTPLLSNSSSRSYK